MKRKAGEEDAKTIGAARQSTEKTGEGSSPEAKERDCFKMLREDKEKQGLKMSIHNHMQPLKVRCG